MKFKLANVHSKSLEFNSVSELDVKKEILNLSSKKAIREVDIPAKILKNSINALFSELTILINNCLKKIVFPMNSNWMQDLYSKRKMVYIRKTIDLLAYYLICQKCWKRLYTNKLIFLLKTSFHHRKNHSAQYLVLKMIENWKKQLDHGEKVGVIFMDLSKTFDTINRSLLLAKLKAYVFFTTKLPMQQISEKHNKWFF